MNMLKELGPPNDICIQHEDTHMVGATSQFRFGNAYYHASIACVHLVWPSFQPSMLVVLPAIECKLQGVHKSLLREKFNMFIQQFFVLLKLYLN